MTAKSGAGAYVIGGAITVARMDWEMQFDWIEGKFVSCWWRLYGY